jgi:branched-chain amino acid transport system ATP-binding protein
MTPLLQTSSLSMRFGGVKAVNDVSLTVHAGEIFSIIGPNGAGKTTFFNCLTGFYPPTAGRIRFQDQDVTGLPPHKVTGLGMARTFQNVRLFAEMTAAENVMVGRHCRCATGWLHSLVASPKACSSERESVRCACRELEFVGLTGKADVWARNLSYGDQRRLEIARALATEPQLLLLDEPGAGMNPNEIGRIMELIEKIRARGITVILIEHHMKLVMSISHRIAVLDHGETLAVGTPGEVANNPVVIQAYLGKQYDDSAQA